MGVSLLDSWSSPALVIVSEYLPRSRSAPRYHICEPFAMKRLLGFGFVLLVVDSAIFSVTANVDCPVDLERKSTTLRLRRDLFCDYDFNVRPAVNDHTSTMVKMRLFPKFIEFDDVSHTLVIHGWIWLSWTDAHLTWNKNLYSGIDSIHVDSIELWKPQISLYNSGDIAEMQSGLQLTDCTVTSNGTTTCFPPVIFITRCTPDYQHWPFDRQNCTLRIGSWAYTKDEVDYQLSEAGIEMTDYMQSHEWKVLALNATKRMEKLMGMKDAHPSVFINVIIERHSTHMLSIIVGPAIVLIIVTLTVLWLDPMSVERMVVAGLNLICHLLCVMEVNWQLPFNGATAPSILIFHQNSMMMACVALFLTAFLRQLKEISIPAPVWLTSTASAILETRVGQYVLLASLDPKASATLETVEDDGAGLVQSSSFLPKTNPGSSNAWHHLATLIDRLSFAGILLTYAIMMLVLMPRNDINDVPRDR